MTDLLLQPSVTGATTGAQSQSGVITSDYQTFLNMLTTQMQNQDPLNPMEATDLAVQLATFSGVEQQVLTNQLLEGLATRMGLAELTAWVGMEVLSAAPAWFSGTPLDLVPPDPIGADAAELVVRDSFGTEVARIAVPPDADRLVFEGLDHDGFPLPEGHYTFELASYLSGDLISTAPVLSYSHVDEARNELGQVLLVLEGGTVVDSRNVIGLRNPQPAAEDA